MKFAFTSHWPEKCRMVHINFQETWGLDDAERGKRWRRIPGRGHPEGQNMPDFPSADELPALYYLDQVILEAKTRWHHPEQSNLMNDYVWLEMSNMDNPSEWAALCVSAQRPRLPLGHSFAIPEVLIPLPAPVSQTCRSRRMRG